ncbi:hypothetical protein A2U01_0083829, partial [Trifolium medium]|nr:hypothetical protein [Trifolium medium]
MIGSADEHE